MKTVVSESYTIAWFKIADFVARGEKERALTVYKLLMHSVSEPALSYQLEGDILLAFDDDTALDRYHVAANLYKKSGKMQAAISVYEHVSLFKEDPKILEALLDTYLNVENKQGFLETFSRFAKYCLQHNKQDFLVQLMHRYSVLIDDFTHALLYARFVRSLLLYGAQDQNVLMYVQQTLDLFLELNSEYEKHSKGLQKFLSDLKILSDEAFKEAEEYLSQS
ncbi:hypothetical protein KBD08_02470 [Candidatus Babeliales bacterium]|nr:hypothetical protein [Candidatus Babeliales bacterium]